MAAFAGRLEETAMAVSPMMKQYQDAKAACPDALLLFRMGDFYELFFDDAKTAAAALGLALTSRDKGENAVPMAGFPYHQLDSYLGKLIAGGFRVAICDQVEDAKEAKGLVRREVTRIVTAGTVTDDALLDPRANNYLAAVVPGDGDAGVAWVELSTGRFQAARFPLASLADELARIDPAECLLGQETELADGTLGERTLVTRRAAWTFGADAARQALHQHFGTATLEGFGFDDGDATAVRAAGAVVGYLVETQKASLAHIDRLARYAAGSTLEIDAATRRSLEITQHPARWPTRGLAVGRDGPHHDGHGLAATGRLARQPAGRRWRRSTRGWRPSPSWLPTLHFATRWPRQLRGVYDSSGCWPASPPAAPARAI